MHYKNGRIAKPGDKIINLKSGLSGILYDVTEESDTCNGMMAFIPNGNPYVTIGDCLHLDDIAAAAVPDASQTPPAPAPKVTPPAEPPVAASQPPATDTTEENTIILNHQ